MCLSSITTRVEAWLAWPCMNTSKDAPHPELLRLLHIIWHQQQHSSQLDFLTSWARSRMNNLNDAIEVPQSMEAFLEFNKSVTGSPSMRKQLKMRWEKLEGIGVTDATTKGAEGHTVWLSGCPLQLARREGQAPVQGDSLLWSDARSTGKAALPTDQGDASFVKGTSYWPLYVEGDNLDSDLWI